MTNIKRITIRKDKVQIQTNTCILTFNKEVKTGCYFKIVEQYVLAPLRYFKCKKYGHHKEVCSGQEICAKCDEKDPDPLEKDCLKEIRCSNCWQDHPVYSRSCDIYKKEKEILGVKHKRNITFLEERKIVGSYLGENTYTSIAQSVNPINQDNKYRALAEKLIQLELNEWPKFQSQLKNLHAAEFQQTQTQ